VELSAPTPLTKAHQTEAFHCGKPALDTFLKEFALVNQQGGSARTYVVLSAENRVVGYYSLAPAGVDLADAPDRVRQGQPRHPVPCILLARLAVDKSAQGFGLGKFLLRDALLRSLGAHEAIGGRAFLVHAMDDEASTFYTKFGMERSPSHPMHLFLLFKDIRRMLSE
jgi:GNAT superfamily N-acetyltransferase